jgi:hypothetical protein
MERQILLALVVSVSLLTACGGDAEESAEEIVIANLEGLVEGWNTIEPGGETTCSDGSPYKFFVRPADPEKVVFYLEGGGGCWSSASCDPDLQPSYKIDLAETDPAQRHGIFAFDEAANPFADYSIVMAPYCTADVHIGDVVQNYEAPTTDEHESHEFSIHHRGWTNGRAVLDWTYEHFFEPETIFVTGSSAGSIPSPFYSVKLAEHYEGARVVALGDGSGGYRGFGDVRPHDFWGTLDVVAGVGHLTDMASEDFAFHQLYVAAAKANSQIALASYDTAEDNVQKQFLALAGNPSESLQPLLDANLEEISAAAPDFRAFVAGGELHTILLRPELYTYRVGEVSFVDWLARLAAGNAVDNVHCGNDCAEAELTETESSSESTAGAS